MIQPSLASFYLIWDYSMTVLQKKKIIIIYCITVFSQMFIQHWQTISSDNTFHWWLYARHIIVMHPCYYLITPHYTNYSPNCLIMIEVTVCLKYHYLVIWQLQINMGIYKRSMDHGGVSCSPSQLQPTFQHEVNTVHCPLLCDQCGCKCVILTFICYQGVHFLKIYQNVIFMYLII